jgi:putative Holliday junction resolvase
MRALAVDFGGKRIGIAIGESGPRVATARPNLEASGTLAKDAQAIVSMAAKEGADVIVVGLPMDADGETKMSRVCRKLGGSIAALGARVAYIDEAYTSDEAERDMVEAGLKSSERRRRSDGEAACRILERYFDQEA